MLLRSSSTPVLGSLLADNSSNHHHSPSEVVTPPNHHFKKVLCYSNVGSQNLSRFSCCSSPSSPCVPELSGKKQSNGFRKVSSAGNLEGLALTDPCNVDDEFSLAIPIKKFSRFNGLETIPSFSFHSSKNCYENDSEDEEEEDDGEDINGVFQALKPEMSLKVAEKPEMCVVTVNCVAEARFNCSVGGGGDDTSGSCGGGGGGYRPVAFGRGGGDDHGFGIEDHYKKMLESNPNNPLFLRNYAHFLYKTKGDFEGAEEYYSRAILADPGDGEVLSQYANLIWELHRDADRASSYFEMAVRAAAEDSHVHAAYARFLWEIEVDEDEENDELTKKKIATQPGVMASAAVH